MSKKLKEEKWRGAKMSELNSNNNQTDHQEDSSKEEKKVNQSNSSEINRKSIGVRFLYAVLYLIVLGLLNAVIQLSVFFQFIYLFFTNKYSNPVRIFTNKVATYNYKIIRYLTLNDNLRPFPFSEFPKDIEEPSNEVIFK